MARAVAALVEQRAAALEQSMESRLRVKVCKRRAPARFNGLRAALAHAAALRGRRASGPQQAGRARRAIPTRVLDAPRQAWAARHCALPALSPPARPESADPAAPLPPPAAPARPPSSCPRRRRRWARSTPRCRAWGCDGPSGRIRQRAPSIGGEVGVLGGWRGAAAAAGRRSSCAARAGSSKRAIGGAPGWARRGSAGVSRRQTGPEPAAARARVGFVCTSRRPVVGESEAGLRRPCRPRPAQHPPHMSPGLSRGGLGATPRHARRAPAGAAGLRVAVRGEDPEAARRGRSRGRCPAEHRGRAVGDEPRMDSATSGRRLGRRPDTPARWDRREPSPAAHHA